MTNQQLLTLQAKYLERRTKHMTSDQRQAFIIQWIDKYASKFRTMMEKR